ncbi:MAG: hypothetical protein FJY67_11660 [Calditrichaeota bacterium]|nr:hypothetical protein [Calditrichota bacterium]
MKIRTLTLIIAAVMLIAVGVLVWPEPEASQAANTIFSADIVWEGGQVPDNVDEIILDVLIYDSQQAVIETWRLNYNGTNNGTSNFKRVEPLPINSEGVAWGVTVTDAVGNIITPQTRNDGDPLQHGGENFLDQPFDGEEG